MTGRLWEIDVARTLAIGLMVVYHAAYDVHLLAPEVGPDIRGLGWEVLQTTCGSLFLGLVGVSFWVSEQRSGRHVRRGLVVLAAAALVSATTWLALGPDRWVRFGILHLIAALVLIVLPLTVRLGGWNALLGAVVVAAGLMVAGTPSDVPGALVLGLDPGDAGADWYPLLPWAGSALLGVAVGSVLYPDGDRGRLLRGLTVPRGVVRLGWAGRHALPIYLVHQPVLVAGLWLVM